jgi:hypothetical protein
MVLLSYNVNGDFLSTGATICLLWTKGGWHNNILCGPKDILGHLLPLPASGGTLPQIVAVGDFQGMQTCPLLAFEMIASFAKEC